MDGPADPDAVLFLGAGDVAGLLDPVALLDTLAAAFAAASRGEVDAPRALGGAAARRRRRCSRCPATGPAAT